MVDVSFLRRLRWVHLAPPLLLASCVLSMYVLGTMLAAEVRDTHAQQQQQQAATAAATVAAEPALQLALPSSFDEAVSLSLTLSSHLRSHPQSRLLVLLLFASVYVLKQAFSIPGSGLLNVMAGFIFGVQSGVPLVAFLTAFGASCCYGLSAMVGTELLACVPSLQARVHKLQLLIAREKAAGSLFTYLLVLRVFPFTPNFFVNLASPLVGVPFTTFFITALFGLVPYVYTTVTAGDTLRTLTELQQARGGAGNGQKMTLADVMDGPTMAKLAVLALCLLIPSMLKRWTDKGTATAAVGGPAGASQTDAKFKF